MSTPPVETPYDRLGGEAVVRELGRRFYDHMEAHEPELTAVHKCDAPGKIAVETRERFTLFLVGWLGGPQDYMARHGHPRLRMRHGHVPIDSSMRDAWLRCMQAALSETQAEHGFDPEVRAFLDQRFAEVADFLRNRPDA